MEDGGGPAVWIDLANSPQVPFFVPIVENLIEAGATVTVTARDFAQTADLGRQAFPDLTMIGGWGDRPPRKALALAERAAALVRFGRGRRFTLAVSHNSYAQIVAARALRLPTVTMMDYEHQPANHLAFRLANLVVVPEAFPEMSLRRFGARRVHRYPGLKEQVYLGRQTHVEDVRRTLGAGDDVLVVVRPPPDFAMYHRFENPLFETVVNVVVDRPGTVVLLLPRTPEQASWARTRFDGRVRVADRVFSSEALFAAADLVIGAGGTMNREAALSGVPTYSLFAGQPSAVDAVLAGRGLLTFVRDARDVERIEVRRRRLGPARSPGEPNPTLDSIVGAIVGMM